MASKSGNIASYNSSHSYYALSNAANGYHDSTNTSYASMNLTRGSQAESYMYWEFNLPAIPTGATINSITCNYKARTSSASTSYIAQATIQMCTGTTTKGTAKSILTTSTNASSFSSTQIGTWTIAELNAGVKLRHIKDYKQLLHLLLWCDYICNIYRSKYRQQGLYKIGRYLERSK